MIYIFSAHPEDAVTFCGGTIAKYVSQGKKVTAVIFSYGENRNPILDPAFLTNQLITASKKAFKLLGSKTLLLGFPDSKLRSLIKKPEIENKIKALFHLHPPEMIITHNLDDPGAKNRAVTKFVVELVEKLRLKPKIYTFGIDLPFRIVRTEKPKLYIDISYTFPVKKHAVSLFKQDTDVIDYKETLLKIKNTFYGLKIGASYAEKFYKV